MKPPYPSYRPSVSEWLEEVPKHWEVKRLGYIADYRTSNVDKKSNDQELPVRLCNYTDVYHQERIWASDGDFMEATASVQEIARFKLSVGDVPITKDSEDWTDIAVPALVEETADDFVCGYHLGIIRPDSLADPAFVFRAMQSVTVNSQLQVSASGVTRYGLPKPAVSEALIPVPPLSEQRAIAGFLDHATAKVDALVAKKRQLIDRLAEYRTALITRTVTKGLPPDVAKAEGFEPSPPLKPSGVEWLGDVPEHWEVKRLKWSASRSDRKIEADEAGRLPYVGLEDVASWTGKLLASAGLLEPESLSNAFASGDVLLGKLRPYLAKGFCPSFNGLSSTEFVVLRPHHFEQPYLLYLLLTHGFISLVDSSTYGVRMPRASWDFIGNTLLPLPPLAEQHAIAAFLDRQTERIEALSARVRAAIERLTEYRSALITTAVNGKIDVRDRGSIETGTIA